MWYIFQVLFLFSVQVVPMGILLAARGCTVEEACRTLSEQPSLRVIIEQCKAPYRD